MPTVPSAVRHMPAKVTTSLWATVTPTAVMMKPAAKTGNTSSHVRQGGSVSVVFLPTCW
ncbi:MAG: hypothetical protein HY261_03280 [Chloroflexi bacterium]|nr:hypothetical protein [Chloroflexota bacterium]